MKRIFQHQFPGIIHQIAYFGSKKEPKIWIDISSPEGKKWFTIDISSQLITIIPNPFEHSLVYSWIDSNKEKAFFSLLENGKNPKSIGIFGVNLNTGTIEEKIENLPIIDSSTYSSTMFYIQNPNHYTEEDIYFKDFQEFFDRTFQQKIIKGIDYLEGDNKLIFSYYLYENTWVNKLKVCNLSFDTLWEETIESTQLMGHKTFQIFENLIIYTKNKNELIILRNE